MTPRRVILILTAILLTFLVSLRATADIEMTVDFFDGFDDPIQGAKRKQALMHALSIWSAALTGTIPVNVHAKFAALGAPGPAGTQAIPFNTLGEVIVLVDVGGTINIKGDTATSNTAEMPTINQDVTLNAINGTVTIGSVARDAARSGFVSRGNRR